MKAKLVIMSSGEKNVFAIFGDGEALTSLGEALLSAPDMKSPEMVTSLPIPDALTGQEIIWHVGKLPEF